MLYSKLKSICEKSKMPQNYLHRLPPQRPQKLLQPHIVPFGNGVELLTASSGVKDFNLVFIQNKYRKVSVKSHIKANICHWHQEVTKFKCYIPTYLKCIVFMHGNNFILTTMTTIQKNTKNIQKISIHIGAIDNKMLKTIYGMQE